MKMWYIALAAMAGSLLRHQLGVLVDSPAATIFINLAGCFLIGFFVSGWKRRMKNEAAAAAVQTGFLGSFTTFSAFSLDAFQFAEKGHYGSFFSYILISVIGGMLLCYAGTKMGEHVLKEKRTGDG